MNAPFDRSHLLGMSSFDPPEALRARSAFVDASAYETFLSKARMSPEAGWGAWAKDLAWSSLPSGVGEAGNWFPGASLNVSGMCLDVWLERKGGDEVVLWQWDAREKKHTQVTREQLAQRTGRLCDLLAAHALQPKQRVMVALPHTADMVAAMLACLRLGLTLVPCDPSMEPKRFMRRLQDSACRLLLTDANIQKAVGSLPQSQEIGQLVLQPGWEAGAARLPEAKGFSAMHPALVVADSSGSLYTLPSAGFLLQAQVGYRLLLDGQGPGDLHWILTPSHHVSFLACLLGALSCGGLVLLHPAQDLASLSSLLEVQKSLNPRVVMVRIKSLMQWVGPSPGQAPRQGGAGPEVFAVEGETVEPRMYHYLHQGLFDGRTHVVQLLSRPECGGFVAGPCPTITPVRPASVAWPAPGMDLAVIDKDGHECPPNLGGLMALRKASPGLAIELQHARMPVPIGVRARQDKDGQFWTMGEASVDRGDEEGLALPELEGKIAAIAGVEQVAVVRYQDSNGALRTRAFLVLSQPKAAASKIEAVKQELQSRFGAGAVPDSFQVVSDLPYSRTGKLMRSILKRIANGETEGLSEIGTGADPDVVRNLLLGK